MDDENMPRASTRSRIPQAGLREMNPATTNARSGMSGILPPGTIANKAVSPTRTKPTSTVEMKRQPPLTRSMVGAPKAHARGNSYASSTMSRPGSTTSRPNNGTLSNTMGYGSRPASAMSRPQTSLGTRKIHGSSISMARPATSLDHHADENAGSVLGKRKDSVWDQDLKEKDMEEIMARVFSRVNQSGQESQGLKEAVEVYKARIAELEASRDGLNETNMKLRVEMESLNHQLSAAEDALKEALRDQEIAMDDLDRRQRIEMESIRQESQKDVEALNTRHQDEIRSLKRKFESELADEKAARIRELGQLTSKSALDIQRSEIEMDNKTREINAAKAQIQAIKADLERERKMTNDLRHNLDTATTNSVTLESTIRALKARIEFLEGGREEQSQAFEQCNQRMMDALAETEATKEKLRREETLRRKLHNQVQELKGNIRVFCRVRPPLNSEPPTAIALMQYPDESEDAKEINIMGPEERSSLGTVSRKNNSFAFDRVFGPSTQNNEVFDEISQLVQSALDGYNVCIFCYGQTGSGKTHTMSSQDGMIPLAVHQIYETAQSLEEKGWRYTMEGNFVEVYNENLNDLLGHPDELDKKKHEIRHDMQRGKTFITDITTRTAQLLPPRLTSAPHGPTPCSF
ncbi:Putative Kinesin-like protein klpA [Penicillium brasilianum]|uniref:Putative Kinesin-like protein klpA n=1 Tax=Penicillium brasilianum TaxID=104259 RepID=A0A0F7U211_PENBI|nr:Putative Kinesin-like protein klpA [Penicillium brasilianum]